MGPEQQDQGPGQRRQGLNHCRTLVPTGWGTLGMHCLGLGPRFLQQQHESDEAYLESCGSVM